MKETINDAERSMRVLSALDRLNRLEHDFAALLEYAPNAGPVMQQPGLLPKAGDRT